MSIQAKTAERLLYQYNINGTPFDGTANIITNTWGHARVLTIGDKSIPIDGSSDIKFDLSQIGVASTTHSHPITDITNFSTGVVNSLPVGTTGQVLKHNGTTWVAGTDNNTTYSVMTASTANAGVSTTGELITAETLKTAINTHAPEQINITGNSDTTNKLKTPRMLGIGNLSQPFDGSVDRSWSHDQIGVPRLRIADAAFGAIDFNTFVPQNSVEFIRIIWNKSSDVTNPLHINAPVPNRAGLLIVSMGSHYKWCVQTFICQGNDSAMIFTRSSYDADVNNPNAVGWSEWVRVSTNAVPWAEYTLAGDLPFTLDLNAFPNHNITATGAITIDNPTSLSPGNSGDIFIRMATNSNVSWGSAWKFLDAQPTINTSGQEWVINYKVLTPTYIIAKAMKIV